MLDSATEPIVDDDTERSRFEIRVGDELAGFVQYHRRGDLIAFVHTEIDERYEGRGLAGRLIAHALDAARAEGLAVLPFCPFVRVWRHRKLSLLRRQRHLRVLAVVCMSVGAAGRRNLAGDMCGRDGSR